MRCFVVYLVGSDSGLPLLLVAESIAVRFGDRNWDGGGSERFARRCELLNCKSDRLLIFFAYDCNGI